MNLHLNLVIETRLSTQLNARSMAGLSTGLSTRRTWAIASALTSAAALVGFWSWSMVLPSEALSLTAGLDGHLLSPPSPSLSSVGLENHGVLIAQNFDLNQAKNLARQRGEAENGGVSVYEAEPSMHGPAAEAPYVLNGNGSATFTFRGRPRGSNLYDVETQVTVSFSGQSGWNIVTNYNREITPTTVSYFDVLNPE